MDNLKFSSEVLKGKQGQAIARTSAWWQARPTTQMSDAEVGAGQLSRCGHFGSAHLSALWLANALDAPLREKVLCFGKGTALLNSAHPAQSPSLWLAKESDALSERGWCFSRGVRWEQHSKTTYQRPAAVMQSSCIQAERLRWSEVRFSCWSSASAIVNSAWYAQPVLLCTGQISHTQHLPQSRTQCSPALRSSRGKDGTCGLLVWTTPAESNFLKVELALSKSWLFARFRWVGFRV